MAAKILRYPNPKLLVPVLETKDEVKVDIVESMRQTLATTNGYALAANQIGLDVRAFILSPKAMEITGLPEFILNPKFETKDGVKLVLDSEGCLSIPGLSMSVVRFNEIELLFQTVDGSSNKQALVSLGARIVQHEIEHLDGKTIVDHLPTELRRKVKVKMLSKGRYA